jgi:hypothetical protein
MRTKLVSVLSLVAFASILGGCGGATAHTAGWVPRYYPAPENIIASKCDVAICDSHTSMAASKF